MHTANPKVIPRNHLVEEALSAAVDKGDMTVLNSLLQVLAEPYADTAHAAKYTEAPTLAVDQNFKTFCGT
jgi:uncharacterized protein YdiU (UPF0061 family)